MSDLPSQYADNIETFRHILNLPDPRDTMPRSSVSVCNSTMEKCQDSLKSTIKKIESQIQKGANPEKAARQPVTI